MRVALSGGGTMHRLKCGDTVVKLVKLNTTPAGDGSGGIAASNGFRYFTMTVSNLSEIMAECEAAGVNVVIPIREIRPGVSISMVEDPDGNVVEFLENS